MANDDDDDDGEAPNLDSNKFAIVIFVNCFIYFPGACSATRYTGGVNT